eukprot:701462_1
MRASLYIITTLFHFTFTVHGSGNITLKASNIQLPTSLHHPITVHNDSSQELIVIPSDQTNTMYSLSPLSQTSLEDYTNSHTFQTISVSQPSVWSKPISCGHNDPYNNIYFMQCHAIINNRLFIMQPSLKEIELPRSYGLSNINRTFDIILLIYDMQNIANTPSSLSYRVTFDDSWEGQHMFPVYQYFYFLPACMYTVAVSSWNHSPTFKLFVMGSYVWLPDSGSSGMVFPGGSELLGHVYDEQSDTWETVEWEGFSAARGGIGCTQMDDQVYLFGGVLYDRELRYGEKCYADPDLGGCQYLNELMQYSRSNFHVSRIYGSGSTALIYGGTTEDAQNHMEVFDVNRERFITTIPINIASLNRNTFTSFILSDVILTIIGGINTENNENIEVIEYMDFSKLLDDEQDATPCITTYRSYTGCAYIDDYLLDSIEHIAFEVYDLQRQRFAIDLLVSNNDNSFDYRFERDASANTLSVSMEYIDGNLYVYTIDVDLDQLSLDTNINMTSDYYVLWVRFGLGIGVRDVIGFGDIVGENSIWNYFVTDNPCRECDMPDNDPVLSVYEIEVCRAAFTFKSVSDSCSLGLQITTIESFAIGDDLTVITNWSLTDATALNYPISISSNDIIDFDYVMTIQDHATITSICTLCKASNETHCIGCDEGIQILDLQTYSIHNNSYKISISSEFENANPKETVITLQRLVQQVQFDIHLSSDDLRPGSQLFITPNYNKSTKAVQANGKFIIEFDEGLSFTDNIGVVAMDFYSDVCTLTYDDEKSINCYDEGIVIPWSMEFKDITSNTYHFSVTSSDTNVIGTNTYQFSRQLQQISVDLSDAIYLGQNIEFSLSIVDDIIVQNTSSLVVSNEEYNIYSIIHIEYNVQTTTNRTIKSCVIDSPNTDITTTCDEGIPFKVSTTEIVNTFINLTIASSDTYIGTNQHLIHIFISECNIGDELFGTTDTTFICSPCAIGSVGLVTGAECFECDETNGVQCMGLSNLIVSYNYWIKVTENGDISSNFCPSGHCCQDTSGCNYNGSSYALHGLCAVGRDLNSPLCGKCIDGYSEVFGSSSCQACDENNYSLLLLPLAAAAALVVILLIIDPPAKPPSYDNINYLRQLSIDDFKAMQLCALRPLLYYYQALSFVTIQNGLFFYLSPLVHILSLDLFESNNSDGSGVCFITRLTSLNKELLFLFFPFCMFIAIALLAAINLCIRSICKRKNCGFLNPGANGVMKIFIILVGNIISTMLKILACSYVDGEYVHFYSGDEACFGPFWWFAFACVFVIVIFWIVVWFKLYKTKEEERGSRSATLRAVTKNYKHNEWYWEFVLLSRRIIISVMVTIQYIEYDVIQYLLLCIVFLYSVAHCLYYPFTYNRANRMETLCLFFLFVALTTTIFEFHLEHPKYISIVMSLIVVAPLVVLIGHIIVAMVNCCKIRNDALKALNEPEYTQRISKWKTRLSPSQRNVYTGASAQLEMGATPHMDGQMSKKDSQQKTARVNANSNKETNDNSIMIHDDEEYLSL